jgi:Domain of unknown function (DUF4349)
MKLPDRSKDSRTHSIIRMLTVGLLVSLAVVACSGSSPNESRVLDDSSTGSPSSAEKDFAAEQAPAEESFSAGETPSNGGSNALPQAAPIRREVIYTAGVTLEVSQKTATNTANRLRKLVTDQGGFVLEDERREGSVRMVLKVLPARFDMTLSGFEKLGKIREQSVTASDVTADMVDLEARLKSAKVSRDRLVTLMGQAAKVADVLVIESELQTREALIEQMQGQLNVLRNQVGYATINLSLFEPEAAATVNESTDSAADGLRNGWVALRNFLNSVVLVLATMLPFILVLVPLVLTVRFGARKWRAKTADRRAERARQKALNQPMFVPSNVAQSSVPPATPPATPAEP